jgi:nucleoside-diphosphate-sugar epimerase
MGRAVIDALQAKHLPVQAVVRSKKIVGVESVLADLFDEKQAVIATAGASHVYLCVGLPYTTKVWQRDWPKLMQSVIKACAINKARLIFFDNVYMYGPPPLTVPFDESSPQRPTTKKGFVRKQIADLLLAAHEAGKATALIGRSADFYGPDAVNSPFYTKFLEQINKGKNPQVLSSPGVKHTYSYTLDNGRALVELALDQSAYGQVWHLPVGDPITLDEIVAIVNKMLGTSYKVSYLPRPLTSLLSLFMTPIRETKEMLYQFNEPYIMSDKKFREKFTDFRCTSYEHGLQAMIESFAKSNT